MSVDYEMNGEDCPVTSKEALAGAFASDGWLEKTKKKDEEERRSKAGAPSFVFSRRLSTLSFAFLQPPPQLQENKKFP
jgi:hypothetical protein